ncbi:QueT transporter family protein [Caldinitratiruptor microaerophilus]|uniref:QueT transporter family protein n=1 Tax=Caldinitratiruptor microaerophilus TaxID=671077 RepID=A0AA35CMX7_9FIRM|nr:QueT transporter family protein [Caldinitratiruptor microaerophilus]BDG61318.1 hypothetical protein caldi_24080 [Caldinitratiruptor microaerophilus]
MKELFTMWRHTRMIVLVALSAALYAAVLIPFKAFPLIPGITEVRVAQVIPPVFSLLFGPAAAWGTAIGNLIGDIQGGTFGPGSAFGFVGNFYLGLIPYALWGRLGPFSSGEEPAMRSGRQVLEFIILTLISAVACAVIIAWGLEVLRLFPFAVLGNIITLNNFLFPAVLGPVLLGLLYGRVKRWGLLWTDIMPEADISRGSGALGTLLAVVGSFGAFVVGNWLSIGVLGSPAFAAGFARQGDPSLVGTGLVIWSLVPFMLALLLVLFTARPRLGLRAAGR